jgi:hypothetical protein
MAMMCLHGDAISTWQCNICLGSQCLHWNGVPTGARCVYMQTSVNGGTMCLYLDPVKDITKNYHGAKQLAVISTWRVQFCVSRAVGVWGLCTLVSLLETHQAAGTQAVPPPPAHRPAPHTYSRVHIHTETHGLCRPLFCVACVSWFVCVCVCVCSFLVSLSLSSSHSALHVLHKFIGLMKKWHKLPLHFTMILNNENISCTFFVRNVPRLRLLEIMYLPKPSY